MDDPRDGVGRIIGGRGRRALPALTSMLTVLLLAVLAGVAIGADGRPAIETLKGDKYRMADAVMADSITRYADPSADQLLRDGAPAVDAPAWSDMEAVHVAATRTPAKLRTKMKQDHPPGASDAFYGSMAKPVARERIVFVAVKMAQALPPGSRGQLVEVGLAGDAAAPLQVGTSSDLRAGVETFSLSGLFRHGALATGDTDVSDKAPGAELDDADYYDVESGVFGFYDSKKATWFVAIPRAGDTDAITVSVHSTTAAGQVIDRLDLPGGGHFIDLREPTGGFSSKSGLPPLSCRSLETFNGAAGGVEGPDESTTGLRYTAGVDASVPAKTAAELLGPALEAAGTVSVALTPIGSEAEPTTVDGELSVSPTGDAVSLTFEVPAGQWAFAMAGDRQLETPTGERIIDHSSLTGTAGVLTGPDLIGFVAGDRSCFPGDVTEATQAGAGTDAAEDGAEAPPSEPEA